MKDTEILVMQIDRKLEELLWRSIQNEDWQSVITIAKFKLESKKNKGRKNEPRMARR